MARDLKLNAILVDKVSSGLKKAGSDWKKILEEPADRAVKVNKEKNKKILDDEEKAIRERIKLQRASAALANRQEAQMLASQMRASDKSLSVSKSNAEAALRIQRQASIAEASLIVDRFDRRIAIERTRHSHILQDVKGNNAAVEAEVRRHNAVVNRIQMDKGNFPNTPFQKMLGELNKVTSMMGVQLPQSVQTASSSMVGAGRASAGLAVGLAAAGAAAVGLGVGLVYSYGEARESLDANKKLDIVLKSTGNTLGYTREQLVSMADEMQKTTDYSDELVLSAETVLLRYDAIGKDIFPRVLRAAADLGAETGDLVGASRDLGMALQVPEEASRKLAGMSIKLNDEQKKLLNQFVVTGEKGKAQAYILELVEKSYGGAAEGMSHSTTILKNQVSELAEELGGPLVASANFAAGALLSLMGIQKKPLPKFTTGDALDKMIAFGKESEKINQNKGKSKSPLSEDQIKEKEKALLQEKENQKRFDDSKIEAENKRLESQRNIRAKEKAIQHRDREADAQQKAREIVEANRKQVESEKLKADQSKQSKLGLDMANASGDPMVELKLRQELELESYKGNEDAITNLKRNHEIQRRKLIFDTSKTLVSGMAGNLATIAGQYKSFGKLAKGAAHAQNAMDTYSSATGAWKQAMGLPPPFGMIAAPVFSGIAVAAGMANASKINSTAFATGTDYAPGGRALVGERGPEYVDLPKGSKVHTANDTARMMTSNNISAPITINISGNADDRTAKVIGETIEQKLKQHAWMTKEVAYRGISA